MCIRDSPLYIQPKLDGVRCLVYIGSEGKLVFQSRQNTIFETVQHLNPHLSHIFAKIAEFGNAQKFVLDGELYIHGTPFNEITSMVRKSNHNDASQLQYHIYDCLMLDKLYMKFNERNSILQELSQTNKSTNIVFVETQTANSLDDIENFHRHYTTCLLYTSDAADE